MTRTKLNRKTKEGSEEHFLYVRGNDLCFYISFYDDRPNQDGKKTWPSPAKAEEALRKRAAQLIAEGWKLMPGYAIDGTVAEKAPAKQKPPPKPAASKARAVTKPSWLKKLPDALEKQRKKLESAVKKAGLAHRYAEIEALLKPSITFGLKKAARAPKEVVSRLGGDPDLSAGASWPQHNGKTLQFIGQIVLSEVKALDLEGVLPSSGRLLFFVQLDELRDDYGAIARVLHVDGPAKRTAPPPKTKSPAAAVGLLTPKPLLTLPYYEDPAINALKLTADERERYHDEVYLALYSDNPLHLLLGYASYGTEHSLESKRFLAQLDADDRIDLSEGDAETLRFYFGAKKPKKDDFADVVCTLEQA